MKSPNPVKKFKPSEPPLAKAETSDTITFVSDDQQMKKESKEEDKKKESNEKKSGQ